MRITGGRARGIVLKIPGRGTLRPATGYMREAVFSSLGPRVIGTRVLDLFAGTGACGLEAVSRGAAHATWVDSNPAAIIAVRANLAAVAKSMDVAKPESLGQAMEGDVFTWQPTAEVEFDLVFVNPPYALLPQFGAQLLARVAVWLAPGAGARLLLEAPGGVEPSAPAGWVLARRLGKGKRQPCTLIFARQE